MPCCGNFTPGKETMVPTPQEARWTPWSSWASAENLTTTWIQSPHQPACSKLLYRPSYPSPLYFHSHHNACNEFLQWCNITLSRIQVCFWFVIIHLGSTNWHNLGEGVHMICKMYNRSIHQNNGSISWPCLMAKGIADLSELNLNN
jgi:hypothetical protein